MNKLIKVLVETPKGKRYLTYKPIPNTESQELLCDTVCAYKDVCDIMRDPRDPENKELSFLDFCASLGDGCKEDDASGANLKDCIPVEGTIERELSDFPDIFQVLIEKNPSVKLVDIIEKGCKGWCDDYRENHCNCNTTNRTCFLKNLFKTEENKENED